MAHRLISHAGRFAVLALLCVGIAACSTTQKSSTGSGDTQDAAPISDAQKPGEGGQTSSSGTSSASGTQSQSAQSGQSGATPTTPGPGDEEAARLKQQLADQDAEINRLRQEQLEAERLAEEEAARQRAAAEAAAVTAQQDAAASQSGTAAAGGGTSSPQSAAGTADAGGASASSSQDSPAATEPLQRSVYFAYDSFVIADDYDGMLIGHAAWLKAHPDMTAEVQGNCDERGSREYNLALGAKRAEAVRRALELAGADAGRIKTVSLGSEKPVAFGQDEESYRQNRRADILY
jgi:peptidoglycan-associated lipoprotein